MCGLVTSSLRVWRLVRRFEVISKDECAWHGVRFLVMLRCVYMHRLESCSQTCWGLRYLVYTSFCISPIACDNMFGRMLRGRVSNGECALERIDKVVVFGGGSFGTAMAAVLARQKAGLRVVLLLRDPYTCHSINHEHQNARYLEVGCTTLSTPMLHHVKGRFHNAAWCLVVQAE